MMKRGNYFTTVWRGGDFKESPVEVNVKWAQDANGELTLDSGDVELTPFEAQRIGENILSGLSNGTLSWEPCND
jgi:hypothetical protein